ncbi:hypothetical protein HN358_00785 [Candidatus Uhrbacteria bacterium]|jgi:hypothetical protein|nr:hypothetical protein [Candidatus Uhrbacteria bacterium]MBT7717421.1 hypothetical protein [Candidatus Uhrbacteria bacterium]
MLEEYLDIGVLVICIAAFIVAIPAEDQNSMHLDMHAALQENLKLVRVAMKLQPLIKRAEIRYTSLR